MLTYEGKFSSKIVLVTRETRGIGSEIDVRGTPL
jgi:hypothetical protein